MAAFRDPGGDQPGLCECDRHAVPVIFFGRVTEAQW